MLEQVAARLRHAGPLDRADALWDAVRPAYDAALRLALGRRGILRVVNGTEPIRLDPRCRTVHASYEPDVWGQVLDAVRPDDTAVDVGANVGLYTVALARRAKRVIAYEPDRTNAALLRRTVTLNRVAAGVDVRERAVGDVSGSIPFVSDRQLSRFHSASPERVPVVRLDEECDRIDVLKVDVEGFEVAVLDGASELLVDESRRPRAVFVEVHLSRLPAHGYSERDVLERLERAGYSLQALSFDGLLTRNWRATL